MALRHHIQSSVYNSALGWTALMSLNAFSIEKKEVELITK